MKTKIIAIAIVAIMAMPFIANGQEADSIAVESKSEVSFAEQPRNEITASIGVVSAFGGVFDFFKVVFEGVGNSIG
ncbi:MAG: hypothetical protein II471_10580, partial [Bacteroidales bacterium]|nr:hypothetical protein [Bacteroidales bacterium]